MLSAAAPEDEKEDKDKDKLFVSFHFPHSKNCKTINDITYNNVIPLSYDLCTESCPT